MNPASGYIELVREILSAGSILLKEHAPVELSCQSLWPLAIALLEGAALFPQLNPSAGEDKAIQYLFDGGEETGPNIYTKMRCIRDLCSASTYALQDRSRRSASEVPAKWTHSIETPGDRFWAKLIAIWSHSCAENVILEVSRLIDDSFEAMIRISRNLHMPYSSMSSGSWDEISRAACHIRDHFDYAEDMVLDCIRPGNDGDSQFIRSRQI